MKDDPEQRIKNAILDFIRLQPRKGFAWTVYNGGIYDPKFGGYRKQGKYYRKGIPDINGIWCHKPLFIEVKSAKGTLSPDQIQFLEDAKSHGAIAFVARSLTDAMKVLNGYETSVLIRYPRSLTLKP